MVSLTLLTSGGPRDACKATLLDFDGEIRVLADPGWNGDSPDDVAFLEKYLGDVDFMVLSHLTPEFIGAYVLLCVKFPMLMKAIPVYATVAVSQLARVATVELYRARGILGPVASALLEVSDVDECFDKVVVVKFQQNMPMLENRIMVSAYNSGHSLGGAFWVFTKRMEKVVYAPTWNHSKDLFLNSASFLVPLTGAPMPSLLRPTTLITGSDLGSPVSHQKRTHKFLQLVDATLANGGAVLLPVAILGRFLELLHVIDDHLLALAGAAIPVYFLSYSGTKVLSYASNLLDWMSLLLIKEYEGLAANSRGYSQTPLEPSKVDLLLDPRELIQLPGPKIVFASGLDFAPGDVSCLALQYLCQDEKLTLILTEKSSFAASNTLTASLFHEWHRLAALKNDGVAEDGVPVPLEKTIPMESWVTEETLSGPELAAFKDRVAALRRQKLLEKVRDKKNKNILNEEDDDDSSSDNEDGNGDSSDEDAGATRPNNPDGPNNPVDPNGPNGLNGSKSGQAVSASALAGPVSAPSDVAADVFKTHEMFVGDYISESLANNKPIDIQVTVRMKPKQATFPNPAPPKKRKFDDYGEVIDMKDFQTTDESNANTKLISESKRKFELNDKGKWGERDSRDEGRRRNGRRGGDHRKQAQAKTNKLTPQEILNNEVLQKNLDALYSPVKRVTLGDANRRLLQAQLKLRCGLSFVDLAGLADLRSLVMIVSVLRPQNLVLLPDASFASSYEEELDGRALLAAAFDKQKTEHKSKIASDSLLSSSRFSALTSSQRSGFSKAQSNEMRVYLSQRNQEAQIGGEGAGRMREFEVRLDESLDSGLKWQKLDGNYRVAPVRGELSIYESQLTLSRSHHGDLTALNSQFILKPVNGDATAKAESEGSEIKKEPGAEALVGAGFGPSLAIGNVRLPELKKKLTSLDLDAEFKGEGMLVVNDEVAIKKVSMGAYQGEDTGDLVIDGQIGPLYYKVKNCIQEMLAFV